MATGWLEEYSKGKTVLAGTSWLDEFKGRKVEGPETRGTLLNESLKATIGALDVAASTAHGISMFVPHLGAQAMGYAAGALLPGVSGKELSEKYGGAVESVTLKPGMIEEAVLGEPGTGRRVGELLSSGFEFFLPVEQIQKNLSRMKELGVPEGIADQVGFWWTKLIELTALHGYGEVARGVPKELASKLSELKNAVDSGAKNRANAAANAIKDLIDEDLSKPDSGPGPSGPEGGSSELKGLIRSGEEEVVRIEKVSAEQPRVREFEGRRIKKLKEAIRLEDIRQEELDRQVLEEGRVEPGTTFDRVDWERRGKFLEVDEVGRILPHRKPLKVVEGANKEIITEGISSREAVLEKAAEQPRIREQIVSEKAVGVLTVPQVEQLASSVAGELGVRADKIKVYPTFSSLPEELQRVHVGRLGSRAPIALNAFRIGKSDPNNPNINKGDIIVIANKMASDAKARRVIAHELLHGMRDRLKEMGRSSKLLDLYDKYSDTQEMKRLVKNYKRDPNIEFDRAFLAEEFAVRILDKAIESGKLDRVSKIAKIIHGETRTRGQIVSEAEAGILKQTKKPKFDVIERKIRAYHPSNEVIAKELESVDIWKEISNETKLRVIDIIRSKQIKDRTEWKNILKEESIFDPNLEAKVLDSRPFEERLEDGLSVWEKEVDEWSKSKLEVIEGGKLPLEEVSKGELGYLYHSTNTLNIDNIRSAGLKTARGGKTPISFGIDEATAKG
ncbi:MAG: hypothetical protein KKD77_20310, partial [Gammaproteobacteria bacterium]|nr:hypothetical protein [Gammaproteobacteria bacterium]